MTGEKDVETILQETVITTRQVFKAIPFDFDACMAAIDQADSAFSKLKEPHKALSRQILASLCTEAASVAMANSDAQALTTFLERSTTYLMAAVSLLPPADEDTKLGEKKISGKKK